ncbi:MAG: iron-sulfur cluster-binding protein [Acidobacteria bacterium]|nr:iron-sulfur cluster-binding protein [Acidobacteriota bacterium]
MSSTRDSFHERVRAAVGDPHLQAALLSTTGRLQSAREQALGTFVCADALRDHARRIRAHALGTLDSCLTRFAEAALARGTHVHWAPTAADAVRYVVELARARHARLVVKSKSMISEEIEINSALEAAGVRVVETDLGEFIVQLGGDRPSHIIMPIIHRTSADVAALFREKLGASDEEVSSIPAMTALARRTLRHEFLRADIGISGANFAVAETGSVCLVTNEGNGRLTTSAPRVHVALIGIERVVPTLDDLGVLLQLLARSATGQPLSVYTSIISGPRRRPGTTGLEGQDGEPDGPDEVHFVLVDNGRSRLLAGPCAEILYCIRCGACLNACPVFRAIGGHAYGGVYPGPIGSVFEPAQHVATTPSELPHASSLCGACRDACPVRIDIPTLLLKLRAQPVMVKDAPRWLRAGMTAFAFVAARPFLYRWSARAARWFTRWSARDGWVSRLPGPLAAWTRHREFPAFAPRSFTEIWHARRTP